LQSEGQIVLVAGTAGQREIQVASRLGKGEIDAPIYKVV
jgi:hypothetical protein